MTNSRAHHQKPAVDPRKDEDHGGLEERADPLQRIWMLSFESWGVAQVGGLGSAVASLARALARDHDVTVMMPGHGRQRDPLTRERLGLREVSGFVGTGERRGSDGSIHPYRVGFEQGTFEGITYLLAKGMDEASSRWLDDQQVYDGELTYQKMSLFARAVRAYAEHLLNGGEGTSRLPDVVHANDWHVVPAAISLKETLEDNHRRTPLVFTVHLLSERGLPWHYVSGDWSGVRDEPSYFLTDGVAQQGTYREVWDRLASGRFERFAALEADYVTSVSDSYLRETVLPFIGQELASKAGYIYNGCDWREETIVREVLSQRRQAGLGKKTRGGVVGGRAPERWELRHYLLTEALKEVGPSSAHASSTPHSPVPPPPPGAPDEGAVLEDGQLVLATGRLDRQKGVDVLMRAVPEVLRELPKTRFLLMVVPAFQRELTEATAAQAQLFPDNVRLVIGQGSSLYPLSYVSADVYAMPSRWEPFGITALEAMVTGNPVVGSRVGGITETVVDILEDPSNGTGRLVPNEDYHELARGLITFLALMGIDEGERRGDARTKSTLLESIPSSELREMARRDPRLGSKIRDNCRRRVEQRFRSSDAAKMAVDAYKRARANSLRLPAT